MDLDSARRAWADSTQVVQSAKKYVSLFDQYMGWLQRREAAGENARGACAFVWKDIHGEVVASASEDFEHMMNQYTMGMMTAYVGDAESSAEHFSTAVAAGARVPVVRGTQRVRYAVHTIPLVGELLQRAQRVSTLTTLTESTERKELALELLCEFPQLPLKSPWYTYSRTVHAVLLEHAMRAEMHGLAAEDRFAEAHAYASTLRDLPNIRFLESMAITARQPLLNAIEYLDSLHNVTPPCPSDAPVATFLGFDAVSV
jgi:hypothetical protein